MGSSKIKRGIHKSKGGLIRSFVTIENGIIKDISISGDFFLFPEEALFKILEQLKGTPAKREKIQRNIEKTYEKENIQSPGTTPSDFTETIMKALEE
ncbi:MAG: lipoate protein ligase C-terminal domain-containing protein [Candidatus Methanoperedens sp.]|nr:lipoate protein ligase C-terminal domain-containing protein [Candidatus Methanoperedens sp.]